MKCFAEDLMCSHAHMHWLYFGACFCSRSVGLLQLTVCLIVYRSRASSKACCVIYVLMWYTEDPCSQWAFYYGAVNMHAVFSLGTISAIETLASDF